jgi:peroxiredoxin
MQQDQNTSNDNLIRKEGFLLKKGRFGKYRRYWFEVDEVSEEVLYYTDNPALGPLKSKLIGNISLVNTEIITKVSKKHYKIIVRRKSGKKTILAADNEQLQQEWKEVLVHTRNFAKTAKQLLDMWKDEEIIKNVPELQQLKNSPQTMNMNEMLETEENESNDTSDAEQRPNEILDITLQNINGDGVTVREALSGQVTLLVLLRQFGCSLCRQECGRLMKVRDRLEDLGVRIVAIGNGTWTMAKAFKNEFNFSGAIYVDQPKKLYRALNTRRGLKFLLAPGATKAYALARKEGYVGAEIMGDPFQMGGLFLWQDSVGFFYQHIQKFAGDFVSLDEVVLLLERFCLLKPELNWCAVPELTLAQKFGRYSVVAAETSLVETPVDNGYTCEPSQRRLEAMQNLETKLIETFRPYRSEFFRKLTGSDQLTGLDIPREQEIWYYGGDGDEKPIDLGASNANDTILRNSNQKLNVSNAKLSTSQASVGPLVIAIRRLPSGDKKAVIFHREGATTRIAPFYLANDKDVLKFLIGRTFYKEVAPLKKFSEGEIASKELLEFENELFVTQYKFGLLYVRKDQTNENDFYANRETSQDYQEFLDFLGPTVDMYQWNRYSGGLSVSVQGNKAIYVEHEGNEIIFHVATLIQARDPQIDPQQVDRKRHLGNDVVMLIFKEGNQKFNPAVIHSQFNHVFVVVQKENSPNSTQGPTKYRVACVYKSGVPSFPPPLPNPPVFEKTPQFRKFLLTKLINAERATLKMTPIFRNKLTKTRSELLKALIERSTNPSISKSTRLQSSSSPRSKMTSTVAPSTTYTAVSPTSQDKIAATLSDNSSPRMFQTPPAPQMPQISETSPPLQSEQSLQTSDTSQPAQPSSAPPALQFVQSTSNIQHVTPTASNALSVTTYNDNVANFK